VAKDLDQALLQRLLAALFHLEGSAVYCRLVTQDGTAVAESACPVEARQLQVGLVEEGRVAAVLELQVQVAVQVEVADLAVVVSLLSSAEPEPGQR
jgi:hypothetical protein